MRSWIAVHLNLFLKLFLFIYLNINYPVFQPSQVYQYSGSVFSFRVDANAFFLPLCREALPVAYLLIQVLMSVTPVRQLAWPHLWQVHWDQCRVGAMSETVTLAMYTSNEGRIWAYREGFGPAELRLWTPRSYKDKPRTAEPPDNRGQYGRRGVPAGVPGWHCLPKPGVVYGCYDFHFFSEMLKRGHQCILDTNKDIPVNAAQDVFK